MSNLCSLRECSLNRLQAVKDFFNLTKSLPSQFIANDVWPELIESHFPGERAKIPVELTQTNLHTAYFRHLPVQFAGDIDITH